MRCIFIFFIAVLINKLSYCQTSFGGVGSYNLSGFGIGFQLAHEGEKKIGYFSRLVDHWGNKDQIAFQAYELAAGLSYKFYSPSEEVSFSIIGLPSVSYQRQADQDDNTLKQFNVGANGIVNMNLNTANNSIVGIFVSKAIYQKRFTAIENVRIGISYSFY